MRATSDAPTAQGKTVLTVRRPRNRLRKQTFVKGFGAINGLNRSEDSFVSVQPPESHPKAIFTSLRSRASAAPTEVEKWEESDLSTSDLEATTLSLSVELLSDRIATIEHMMGECIEAVSVLSRADRAPPPFGGTDAGLRSDLASLEDRLVTRMEALSEHLKPQAPSGADALARTIQTQLAQLETRLDAPAAQPAPHPDTSAQHDTIAKILTTVSAINSRQDAMMEQIDNRLAAFLDQQGQQPPVVDTDSVSAQIQAHLDTRLDALETVLAEGVADQSQNSKTLINIRKAFEHHTKKLVLKLDTLHPAQALDTQALTEQLCQAIETRLPQPADMDDRATVAPELLRSLRFAVAEIMADMARQTAQADAPSAQSE